MFVKTPGSYNGNVHLPLSMDFPADNNWLLPGLLSERFGKFTATIAKLDAFFALPAQDRTMEEFQGVRYNTRTPFSHIPAATLQMVFDREIKRLEETVKGSAMDKLFHSDNPDDIRLWHKKRATYLEGVRDASAPAKMADPNGDEEAKITAERRSNYDEAIAHHRRQFREDDHLLIQERDQCFRNIAVSLLMSRELEWPEDAKTSREATATLLENSPELAQQLRAIYSENLDESIEGHRRAQAVLMNFRDRPESFRSARAIIDSIREVAPDAQFEAASGYGVERQVVKWLVEDYGLELA
jgi:hypothetical protein